MSRGGGVMLTLPYIPTPVSPFLCFPCRVTAMHVQYNSKVRLGRGFNVEELKVSSTSTSNTRCTRSLLVEM